MKTYGELKQAVQLWAEREDDEFIARVPDFIRLAESEIFRVLRTRDNEFTWEITADLEADPVVDPINPITLPANFLEVILIEVNGRPLTRMTDTEFAATRLMENISDTSICSYFMTEERALRLYPWPDQTPDAWNDDTIMLKYYGTESLGDPTEWNTPTNPVEPLGEQIESRTDNYEQTDQNTTRALQRYPDAFLCGSLKWALKWLKNPEESRENAAMFAVALNEIKKESRIARYAGSTMGVQNVYGTLGQSAYSSRRSNR